MVSLFLHEMPAFFTSHSYKWFYCSSCSVCYLVCYLGVVLDSNLSFSANISKTVSPCFCALRRIHFNRKCITRQSTRTLVTSLVLSRLDYCLAVVHAGLQQLLHAAFSEFCMRLQGLYSQLKIKTQSLYCVILNGFQ